MGRHFLGQEAQIANLLERAPIDQRKALNYNNLMPYSILSNGSISLSCLKREEGPYRNY